MPRWIGVDVGGKRKGFDLAVIDEQRLLALHDHLDVNGVLALVSEYQPSVVAIDSPRCFAPDGKSARAGERQLAREICGIRWTPDASKAVGDYYAWIHEGLALYQALEPRPGPEVIEVFPTASWTRWLGKRGKRSRADWTTAGLARLDLDGLPKRTNQDQRDAIAAAVTARLHTHGDTEALGELVVPKTSAVAAQVSRVRDADGPWQLPVGGFTIETIVFHMPLQVIAYGKDSNTRFVMSFAAALRLERDGTTVALDVEHQPWAKLTSLLDLRHQRIAAATVSPDGHLDVTLESGQRIHAEPDTSGYETWEITGPGFHDISPVA
jgi:predicted nuclease with RNAse H fold